MHCLLVRIDAELPQEVQFVIARQVVLEDAIVEALVLPVQVRVVEDAGLE